MQISRTASDNERRVRNYIDNLDHDLSDLSDQPVRGVIGSHEAARTARGEGVIPRQKEIRHTRPFSKVMLV